ncbi:hypothetical protein ACLB2K_017727 [Fragaria x ananassa]
MAPKRLLQDPPAASSMEEDSDAETVDEEEEEVQNDVVEDEEDKSGDEEDDEDEEEDDAGSDGICLRRLLLRFCRRYCFVGRTQMRHFNVVLQLFDEFVNVGLRPDGYMYTVVVKSLCELKDLHKAKETNPPSESASDAGSETESDAMTHSPTASYFTVKPIVSKPMNDSPAKPTKKTAAAAAPAKRAAESDPNPKDSKKKKKGSSGSGEDEETKKAGRLWGEDDEIAILEGMIEFKAKNGTDPSSNMSAFHEFLRRSLKADVNKNQLRSGFYSILVPIS